jgi:hypothetical protein
MFSYNYPNLNLMKIAMFFIEAFRAYRRMDWRSHCIRRSAGVRKHLKGDRAKKSYYKPRNICLTRFTVCLPHQNSTKSVKVIKAVVHWQRVNCVSYTLSTQNVWHALEYASVDVAKTPNRQSRATKSFCSAIMVRAVEFCPARVYRKRIWLYILKFSFGNIWKL